MIINSAFPSHPHTCLSLMGCATSNLNDLPAVFLCRQRCALLDETIRHCYALSVSHLSYINSLQSLALSLQQLDLNSPSPLSPPPYDSDHFDSPPFTNYTELAYPQGLISFPAAAYMKHNATPSQAYEQMPTSPHDVHMGGYSHFNPSSFFHTDPNPSHYFFGGRSSGYSSVPSYWPKSSVVASSSQPPPRTCSRRDLVNSYHDQNGQYHSQRTTSQDYLKEIREEEGIPDLEDDDEAVQGDQSDADDGSGTQDNQPDLTEASLSQTMPIRSMGNDDDAEQEHEVHADDDHDESFGDAFEVASKIEVQFRRASEAGMEMARIIDMGTLPYCQKHGANQAFSKMLRLVALPLSLKMSRFPISKVYKNIGPKSLELDGDLLTRSRNLSSTLQKLHLWEKKLYKEVKAEEKIRVLHDRKCRILKRLDERGADFDKVDIAQTSIKNLSTKMRMAIQVVDLISVKINKIRDEELWPRMNELIEGLTRMWKCMLECHRSQCEAIREAGIVGWMGSRKANREADRQVEQEVINWTLQFCSWISAQKRYVRALNNWLLKCLAHEPEGTGGPSPGRMGAPRVFVICNRWSQAMERMCEKDVLERMYVFNRTVLQIWKQERLEMVLDKDVERNDIDGERDREQRLQKQMEAVERQMVGAFREVNRDSVDEEGNASSSTSSSLEGRLQQILEAMERFSGICAGLYQELLQTSHPEA